MAATTCCIDFSGIRIRFHFPTAVELPEELNVLQSSTPAAADEEFEICLISEPLSPDSEPAARYMGTDIYSTDKGWLRIYTPLTVEDGCQVACLLCPDGKNQLYFPASAWDIYSTPLRLLPLICGEALLIKYDAFLLHSSVVMVNGKMVLFSGPSGAGKSTQADLWVKYRNAELINGDRCVVRKHPDGFYGGGSPWSGSSRIRRPEYAPIAGIFLVHQAGENSLQRLGYDAFAPLFTQTTLNTWDSAFMDKLTGLYADLIGQIPIFKLNCRPDEEAVRLVYDTLF